MKLCAVMKHEEPFAEKNDMSILEMLLDILRTNLKLQEIWKWRIFTITNLGYTMMYSYTVDIINDLTETNITSFFFMNFEL